ncbi:hypothetical protein DFH01_03780 [Falsiroseomonas bella]|uniref:Uncharacterized protein n=1 Tax=Falsiroseomonas bella TaxID=2184016 RepID=A0A317FI10_9PROT|nr:hypothetical protein [Falsiroseomonas bella]PWS38415.1 hypothetical protein DFH01_03780 [Falsiroseomonas bella]
MRPIRRAAVTGLFALWLAPLPALAGSQYAEVPPGCPDDRSHVVERRMAAQDDPRSGARPHRTEPDDA